MINYKENYNKWLEDNFFDEETREELSNLIDEKEIEDRFYRDLEFGTGGLRGVMGAGTNRMNKYTIGKATKGLGTYLLDHYGVEVCAKKGVVIGYDTRNNSKDFSEITANVLTGMGIKVFLHSEARPTPQLSFSVKFLNALAGVVITASHNPKEYNGYKVYVPYYKEIFDKQNFDPKKMKSLEDIKVLPLLEKSDAVSLEDLVQTMTWQFICMYYQHFISPFGLPFSLPF